jgi:hypothetical protein
VTDALSARTSKQVLIDGDVAADARSTRTSVQALVGDDIAASARSARLSIQVLISAENFVTGGGWGAVSMGIS